MATRYLLVVTCCCCLCVRSSQGSGSPPPPRLHVQPPPTCQQQPGRQKRCFIFRDCACCLERGSGFFTGSALVPPRTPRLAPLFSVPVHSPLVPRPPWALSISPRTDRGHLSGSRLLLRCLAARSGAATGRRGRRRARHTGEWSGARPPPGGRSPPALLPALLPARARPAPDRRGEKGAGRPVRVWLLLGAVPACFRRKSFSSVCPSEGRPRNCRREAGRPWTEARRAGWLRLRDGAPRPYLAPAAPPRPGEGCGRPSLRTRWFQGSWLCVLMRWRVAVGSGPSRRAQVSGMAAWCGGRRGSGAVSGPELALAQRRGGVGDLMEFPLLLCKASRCHLRLSPALEPQSRACVPALDCPPSPRRLHRQPQAPRGGSSSAIVSGG